MWKRFEYFSSTANLSGAVGLPDNTDIASSLTQVDPSHEPDTYRLQLTLDELNENQVRAIMTIVNALDGWRYTEKIELDNTLKT